MKLFVALIIFSIAEGFTIPSYGSVVSTQLQVSGFTGFGHATGDIEEETPPTASFTGFGHAIEPPTMRQTESASAPALSAPAVPVFTGFGHATGEAVETIETSAPVFSGFDHATRVTESASAPALSAPAPVFTGFTGFGHATGEAVEKIEASAPVFSGFAHATRVTESASAPALSTPAPVFSGFGHAISEATETSSAPAYESTATGFSGFGHALDSAEPAYKAPTPAFSGFGHSFVGATTPSDSATAAAPVKSPLEEAKEFLLQATAKATKLREIMQLKENQNGSRVEQLAADLLKQEEACRSYQSQISSISAEFEEYKRSTGEEQFSLKEDVAKKDVEMNAALVQAREICALLDELIDL